MNGIRLGCTVLRLSSDYTSGRVGRVIEIAENRCRACVLWEREPDGCPMRPLRTWVRVTDLLSIGAARIGERAVTLDVSFKTPSVSDTNTFQETFGGITGRGPLDAFRAVDRAARAWVSGLRADGTEVSAWDAVGACY